MTDPLDFDKLPNALLAERLQADATVSRGYVSRGYANRAAVHLLTRANRGDLLWQDAVRESLRYYDGTLRVDWAALRTAHDNHAVAASSAAETMLDLALALAANRPLDKLGGSLGTLDPVNKRIVLEAFVMATGLPVTL